MLKKTDNAQPSCARAPGSTIPTIPDMTALYLERYLNYGLSLEELQSGKPIIGIAQTGSDLSPCNRHHIELAKRVRDGIREAGGIADRVSGPSDPGDRQAPDRRARPQPRLSRPGRGALRLSARRRRADHRLRQDHAGLLMAAATVNIPAIALSVGPMLNGWFSGERTGSGTIVWKARELMAAGEIDYARASSSSSPRRRPRPATATRWARRRR